MAGPAESVLKTPAFWGMTPAQQRVALERADPRFQALSNEQMRTFLTSKSVKYSPPTPTASREETDIIGRLKKHLVAEPPAGSRTLFGETDIPGRVVRAIGDLFLPASIPQAVGDVATLPVGGGLISGPVKRVIAGAVGAGSAGLAQSGSVSTAATEAGQFAAQQALGEVLPGMVRGGLYAKKGAEAARLTGQKNDFNKAMTEALTGADKAAYTADLAKYNTEYAVKLKQAKADYAAGKIKTQEEHTATVAGLKAEYDKAVAARETGLATARATHAETSATNLADTIKETVPPWREYPSNTRGLLDMLYGSGPEKLSQFFDAELKQTIASARGKRFSVSMEDAMDLGLKNAEVQPGGVVTADAGDVAAAIVGKWRTAPALYRRIVGGLVDLGVGNDAAREAYKTGMGFRLFADKTKMITPPKKAEWVADEVFHLDRAQAGLTSIKMADELRRRGLGNALEGPIADVTRTGVPPIPPEVTPPTMPPTPRFLPFQAPPKGPAPQPPSPRIQPSEVTPSSMGVETTTLPTIPHPFGVGGAVAELPFLLGGQHEPSFRLAAPFLIGGGAASLLSGRSYTSNAPMSSLLDTLLRVEPLQAGQAIRQALDIIPAPPSEPPGQ